MYISHLNFMSDTWWIGRHKLLPPVFENQKLEWQQKWNSSISFQPINIISIFSICSLGILERMNYFLKSNTLCCLFSDEAEFAFTTLPFLFSIEADYGALQLPKDSWACFHKFDKIKSCALHFKNYACWGKISSEVIFSSAVRLGKWLDWS